MAAVATRAVKLRVTRQLVAVFVGCVMAGCGTGNGPDMPTPGPTRAPLPTLVPGAPTPLPPRPPVPPTLTPTPTPVMMMFTFRNACAAAQVARLRLFDETLDLVFLDDMHDYLVTGIPAEISIGCRAGWRPAYSASCRRL